MLSIANRINHNYVETYKSSMEFYFLCQLLVCLFAEMEREVESDSLLKAGSDEFGKYISIECGMHW